MPFARRSPKEVKQPVKFDTEAMDKSEKIIEVDAPLETVFKSLGDYESYPRWMHNVTAVRKGEDGAAEWFAVAPPGSGRTELRWTTETTTFEPDRRIVWRSLAGDVAAECEVFLQETKRGSTVVRMVRRFDVKTGHATDADRTSLAEHQRLLLEEDLARFKHFIESSIDRRRTPAEETRHTSEGEHGVTGASPVDPRIILRRGVDRLLDDAPSKEWLKGKEG